MRLDLRRRAKRLVGLVTAFTLMVIGWYAYVLTAAPRTVNAPLVIPVSEYVPGTVSLDHGVWIARQPSGEFYVFLNRDPHRGQPLNWVESKGLFIQAAFYGIDGICHGGPCDPSPGQGLHRVESQLEGQNLIVYPQKIISGGFSPEPSRMTNLKHFFTRRLPNAPSPSQRP